MEANEGRWDQAPWPTDLTTRPLGADIARLDGMMERHTGSRSGAWTAWTRRRWPTCWARRKRCGW